VHPGQDVLWISAGPPPPDDLAARFTGVEGPEYLHSGVDERLFHTFFIWRLRDARQPA